MKQNMYENYILVIYYYL